MQAPEGGSGGKGKAELDFYYAPLLPGSAQTSVVLTSKEVSEQSHKSRWFRFACASMKNGSDRRA
eukprot:scaffold22178_cov14-Tisochrysis_lutea.AAC.1